MSEAVKKKVREDFGRLIPLYFFQSKAIPLRGRVLLVLASKWDSRQDGWTTCSTREVARWCGEVSPTGEITSKNEWAIRKARTFLIQRGYLEHQVIKTDQSTQHRWRVIGQPLVPGTLENLKAAPNAKFVDRWAEAEEASSKPSATKPAPTPTVEPEAAEEAAETPRELPNIARDEDGAPTMNMDHLMRASADFNPWDLNLNLGD